MPKVAISNYSGAVELNLWSHLFELVPITKANESSIEQKLDEIASRFKDENLNTHAVQVRWNAARYDVRLKAKAGGRKRPGALVKEKWESDELTVIQLNNFWTEVNAAVAAGGTDEPIRIEDFAKDTIDVDLWGADFTFVQVKASTEATIDEQLKAIEEAHKGDDPEAQEPRVLAFAERMDVWLRPVDEKVKASALINGRWEDGKVNLAVLNAFWDAVVEEVNRP